MTITWNYRILRHEDRTFALHEVYYDETGEPRAYTAEPIGFYADEEEGPDAIVASLEMALRDARERPILNASAIGGADAGTKPASA